LTVTASADRWVTGIAIRTQPTDLTYTAGESLSLDGLVVTLTYNDESTLEVAYEDFVYMGITADPAHGTALSAAEHHDKPVTVTCNGKTASTGNLTVTASADRWVTGIAIRTQPTDLTYTAGESLSLEGLVVTLTYNDESTLEVAYEDFIYMGITADPAHGTSMARATHHNRPVTVTCNGQTAATNNLTVTAGSSGGNSGGSSGSGANPPAPPPPGVNAVAAAGDTPETTLPVSVSNGNGTVSLEASTAEALFGEEGTALVTIPPIAGLKDYTLEMPAFALAGSQGGETLTLSTEAGSITLPGNMLLGGLEAEAQKVSITLGEGDKSLLPEDVREALGDRPLIRLSLAVDGQQTSWSNENAPVTVSIPYTPTPQELANPESIVIWYIDGSGNTVSVPNGRYDPATGTVTFATTHFSYFAVGYNQVSFKDVAADAWYGKAVAFISAREITTGTGNGHFSPEEKLTRGQFIVMLMKAYGIAPDTDLKDNFADAGSTYYTGYLAAAKRLGISAGVGNNLFMPAKEITRQEMFTLLYNALKAIGRLPRGNSGKSLSAFSDAGDIAPWAKDAMTLLAETGTIGGSGGKLAPADTTTRAQMAQVLYVLLSK
jgi:Trk K+ transport system NAD-binding subunit